MTLLDQTLDESQADFAQGRKAGASGDLLRADFDVDHSRLFAVDIKDNDVHRFVVLFVGKEQPSIAFPADDLLPTDGSDEPLLCAQFKAAQFPNAKFNCVHWLSED